MFELSPPCGNLGVSPAARRSALAGLDLGRLEPVHVGDDSELVAFGLGGGEDHGLQGDRVGAAEIVGPESAEVIERLADDAASRPSRRRSAGPG